MAEGTIVWGVLGAAKINDKVVPPMTAARHCRVKAIASRSAEKSAAAAAKYGLPVAYDSYEALLADPEIDAVYIPLPNHLHVEWTIKAAEAGKHVLCEKPIGLNAEEARRLIAARDKTGRRIQEAFMVRTHPQWLKLRELVQEGAIGELRAVDGRLHLSQHRPQQHPQQGRYRRRRAAGHRLLPDHHLALRHRARAAPGGVAAGPRPGVQGRPAGQRPPGL